MSSGTGDKLKGMGDELSGRTKSAVGGATGDENMEAEGNVDRAKGQARDTMGDAKNTMDKVGDKLGGAVGNVADKLRGNKS